MSRSEIERAARRRRGRRGRRAAFLLLGALLVGASSAQADVCTGCREPGRAELQQDPGYVLKLRLGALDYVQTDGGECRVRLDGLGPLKRIASWLMLRGLGEVWNCPSANSCDTVTVSVNEGDTKAWTLTGTANASAKILGLGLSASLTRSVNETVRLTHVTTISKYLCTKFCRRMYWQAWFEIVDYRIDAFYTVQRRYAWWTKNPLVPGIHARGNVWVDCASGVAELRARSPISAHWRLRLRGCNEPECGVVPVEDLGWFPRPRQGLRLFPPDSEVPIPDDYRLPPVPPGPSDEPDEGAEPAPPTALPPAEGDEERPGDEPPEAPPPPSSELGDAPTGPLPDPMDAEPRP